MNDMRLIFRRWSCPPDELDMHEAGKQNGDSLDDAARGSMHEAVKQIGNLFDQVARDSMHVNKKKNGLMSIRRDRS